MNIYHPPIQLRSGDDNYAFIDVGDSIAIEYYINGADTLFRGFYWKTHLSDGSRYRGKVSIVSMINEYQKIGGFLTIDNREAVFFCKAHFAGEKPEKSLLSDRDSSCGDHSPAQ